jgi:exodeoxyribonuclease VII large subunit
VDVIIAGRGGGSLEDLWAFNEESVARAISGSRIPVISAVGHETDYTISDFVADQRAPTPSAAAEIVVKSEENFCAFIESLEAGLRRNLHRKLEASGFSLQQFTRLLTDPRRMLLRYNQRVDELSGRLVTGLRHHVRRDRAHLTALAAGLEHLNPLGILSRGYSVTRKFPEGTLLKEAAGARAGELISTTLYNGEILSRVEKTGPGREQ